MANNGFSSLSTRCGLSQDRKGLDYAGLSRACELQTRQEKTASVELFMVTRDLQRGNSCL